MTGRRVLVAVKTNAGGAWIVPIVRDLVAAGADVLCIVADEDGPLDGTLRSCGAQVRRSACLGGRGLFCAIRELPRLALIVRRFRPHTINYHLYRTALVMRVLSLLTPGARRVHSVPGPLFLEQPVTRAIERLLARRDHVIVCTADVTRRTYRKLGFPSDRLAVVPYPLDLQRWSPFSSEERAEARAKLGLELDSFVVAMVAYYYPPRRCVLSGLAIKGHDVLLEAWRRFRRSGGSGTLLLVGGGFGPHGSSYRTQLFDRFGVEADSSVLALDAVDSPRELYAACDVSVAPSRSENLGSAAEASALGIPTIASDVGGLPELVIDGATGWLVPPDDVEALATALLAASNELRSGGLAKLGDAAHTRVAAFAGQPVVLPRWRSVLLGSA